MRRHELIRSNIEVIKLINDNKMDVSKIRDKLMAFDYFCELISKRILFHKEAYEIIAREKFQDRIKPRTVKQWVLDMNKKVKEN